MRSTLLVPSVVVILLTAAHPGAVAQTISTVIPASEQLNGPAGLAQDTAGTLYVVENQGNRIRKTSGGPLTTVTTGLNTPIGLTIDGSGNLYVADRENNKVKKITPAGVVTDFAGIGTKATNYGDGGPATSAELNTPSGVVFDNSSGSVVLTSTGHHLVRRVSSGGIINTVAGTGVKGFADGAAGAAQFYQPYGLALDKSGNIYVADYYNCRVRKISGGTVTTLAGSGSAVLLPGLGGYSGDDGPGTAAKLNTPAAVAVDAFNNVYVADTFNHCIRKINTAGVISRFAGTCTSSGNSGDGGPALNAKMSSPTGLLFDKNGDLLFSDSGNNIVRKISMSSGGGGGGGGSATKPAIRSSQGILQAFSGSTGVSSGTWLEIYGTNFGTVSRSWAGPDFSGNRAPTQLEGVGVTVNDKPAFISYVSPTQVNIQTPDDATTGSVQIRVTGPGGTSDPVTVLKAKVSPAMLTTPVFNVGGRQYLAALFPDFATFVGRTGLIAGVAFRPAKPGDTIIIYAVGCGATNPASPAGQYFPDARPLASSFQLAIGGMTAQANGFLAAQSVGLCQFNAVVPQTPDGDVRVDLTIDGVSTGQTLYTTVQR